MQRHVPRSSRSRRFNVDIDVLGARTASMTNISRVVSSQVRVFQQGITDVTNLKKLFVKKGRA
jgi:hypothetical protein